MRVIRATILTVTLSATAGPVLAQDRPAPQSAPRPQSIDNGDDQQQPREVIDNNPDIGQTFSPQRGTTNRTRMQPPDMDELVTLSMADVKVDMFFQYLADSTGKIVVPINLAQLGLKKLTVRSSAQIPRWKALDMMIETMRLNGIGVVEREDMLIVGDLAQITQIVNLPLLGPEVDIRNRIDTGTIVIKMFQVEEVDAEAIGENLADLIPDTAIMTVDPNSNMIILQGDLGLCKNIGEAIERLDRNYVKEKTQTFFLQYADAAQIADNITELFEDSGAGASGGVRNIQRRTNRAAQRQQPAGAQPGPEVQLLQTVNVNTNSVTVKADPATVRQIEELISNYWDLPRSAGTSRVYPLQHTDPLVMRDTLQTVLGQGGVSTSGRRSSAGSRAGGQASDVTETVSGIYQIEAVPDKNALVVLCKTEQSFDFLDQLIKQLDQPSTISLPIVVQLKHANAVELTQELNILLAASGSNLPSLRAPDSGLAGRQATEFQTQDGGGGGGGNVEEGQEIQFPWQSSRGGAGGQPELSDPSPLVGKVRIVPIIRQNALAVLAPPAEREGVRDLIHFFDRPGRQVMISAIIAEVELNDDFAFGLRTSSGSISPANPDNLITGSISSSGTENDFLDALFDTSVLDAAVDINLALQALDRETNVRIMQEPRVFTSDNREAVFFDGQDIPFISNSNTTDQGGLTQSFDYRSVGVVLNVRPRITSTRAIDLEINLELSNIVAGQTLFGGAIIDIRQTTTQVIIENEQTVVISGIIRDSENQLINKVPLLGDIPLIGELFTSRENATTRSELIAFITPTVIDNPSDLDEYSRDDRRQLESYQDLTLGQDREELREDIKQRINRRLTPVAPSRDADANADGTNAVPIDVEDVNDSWNE